MRQTVVLLCALTMLVAQPLAAAQAAATRNKGPTEQTGPLSPGTLRPGKPAGVNPAQAGDIIPIYGGVLLFGALLAATIGVNGSSVPPNTAASGTSFCCG